MKESPKVALTIGGSDSGGGAGIQADIKTFSALGLHGASVITAVTAQNTLGVDQVFGLDPKMVLAQLESVSSDFQISFAKTGMLFSPEIVLTVSEHIKDSQMPLVVDPVIEAEAGGRLLKPEALQALIDHLMPLAKVITPNIFEAKAISGVSVKDTASAKLAARRIEDLGAKAVIIKGGHLDCIDLLLEAGEVHLLKGIRVAGDNHGVGCTYSAALTSYLALGCQLLEAAAKAKIFAATAISRSMAVGKGVGPVSQSGALIEDAKRFRALSEVQKAVEILIEEPLLLDLIPEMESNIGMAISGATSSYDVAAVEGGLFRAGKRLNQSGCVKFGASNHVARTIIAAMSFDPRIKAAMNLNLNVLEACRDLGLETASFCRDDEPEGSDTGIGTMSWGTGRAIRDLGHVPTVIWDAGGYRKAPMARLLGPGAVSVAQTAVKLARTILQVER